MPRGGARRGRPGKGYSNRTDLGMDYGPGSAGNGGMAPVAQVAPAPQQQAAPAPMQFGAFPEDTPGLLDPTQRPNEPITDGLPIGPGRGDMLSPRAQSATEPAMFKAWLPMLQKQANSGSASPTFVRFVRFLRDR